MISLFEVIVGMWLFFRAYSQVSYLPEQLHVTFHPSPEKLSISWVSFELSPYSSLVQYGTSAEALTEQKSGTFLAYPNEYCGSNSTRSVHTAVFDINEGETIFYRVSSDEGTSWSDVFKITGKSRKFPLSLALFGDMGVNCDMPAASMLTQLAQNDEISFVHHFGDVAYNMNDECGVVGDIFLNAVMSYSTIIPVVYSNGNHESGPYKTYYEYIYRLADAQNALAHASGSTSNRYFSWRVGRVMFFAIDTDAYIYPLVYDLAKPQYEWLERALSQVNRTETPWVVMTGHRAMYCTKSLDAECNREALTIREGHLIEGQNRRYGIEPLLEKYKVDLYFAGHTHHYERTYPVDHGTQTQNNYVNPAATVHIQSGIAGVDGYDTFTVPQKDWEAYRDTNYVPSFSKLTFVDDETVKFEQISSSTGEVLDFFSMTQNLRGKYR